MSTLEANEIPQKRGSGTIYAESFQHPPFPHTRSLEKYYAPPEKQRTCGRSYAITHYFHPFERTHAPVASQDDLRNSSLRRDSPKVREFLAEVRKKSDSSLANSPDGSSENDRPSRFSTSSPYARIYSISSMSQPFEPTRCKSPPQWKEFSLKREQEGAWERSFTLHPHNSNSTSSVAPTSTSPSSDAPKSSIFDPKSTTSAAPPVTNGSSAAVTPKSYPSSFTPTDLSSSSSISQTASTIRPVTTDVSFRSSSSGRSPSQSSSRGKNSYDRYLTIYSKDYVRKPLRIEREFEKQTETLTHVPDFVSVQERGYSPSYNHGRRALMTSKFPPFEPSKASPPS